MLGHCSEGQVCRYAVYATPSTQLRPSPPWAGLSRFEGLSTKAVRYGRAQADSYRCGTDSERRPASRLFPAFKKQ